VFESSRGIKLNGIEQRVVESAVSAELIEPEWSECVEDSARYSKLRLLIVLGVLFCAGVMVGHAATIIVTNTNDNGPGSLREALAMANNGDTINFAVTGTITLTSGGLPINKNITISGPGADQLSIDANQALFVFGVFPDRGATISGLTVRNAESGILNDGIAVVTNCVLSGNSSGLSNGGVATVSSCVLSGNSYSGLYAYEAETTVSNCVVSGNAGGGLFNNVHFGPNNSIAGYRSMTIVDSIISDNLETGILNYGDLTVLNSTLIGNSTAVDGGAIASGTFKAPASVTVINSTLSGNSASGGGGGIANSYWGVTIVNSTISGNSAGGSGGGISSSGGVQISNSTISDNSADKTGGGLSNFGGGVRVANSTISGNSAASGGGIYNVAGQFGGSLETSNTIFNAGASGENIVNDGGTVTSHGYNISSDDGGAYLNGPGDQINTDPLLGPLQDNGGPTLTHLPLPGSPAIDAGDPNFMSPPFRDQRGACFHRVFGRRIDVGSVETQPQPRCATPAPRPGP
jgi:hypothetical protein